MSKITKLLVGVTTVVILGSLNASLVTLDGNLGLSSARLVVVVDGSGEVGGAHDDGVDLVVWIKC